jgi:hypothetical protein
MNATLSHLEGDGRATTAPASVRNAVWLARLIQAGVLTYTGLLALLHVTQPELSPVIQPVGEYIFGPFGAALAVASLALGGVALALAAALALGNTVAPRTRAGALLLGLWGGGLVVAGLVPIALVQSGAPEPAARFVQGLVELVSFPSILAASFVIGRAFRRDGRWGNWRRPSLVLSGAAAITYAALILAPVFGGYPTGLPQRLFLALVLAWLSFTASHLRGIAGTATRTG